MNAMSVIYGCAVGVPVAFWFGMRSVGVPEKMSILQIICLYSYSLLVFIPATLLCAIFVPLRWVILILAAG